MRSLCKPIESNPAMPFSRLRGARVVARALPFASAGLCAGLAFAIHAQTPVATDAADPSRDAFLASHDVDAGLTFLDQLRHRLPDVPTESDLAGPCWAAAQATMGKRPTAVDAQVDDCLYAAAASLDPDASFHRPPKFNQPAGPAGVGLAMKRSGDALLVTDAFPGSPAVLAGVQAGDLVTAIDARPVAGETLDQSIARIRGAPGASVRLSVVSGADGPGASAHDVVVTRARYAVPSFFVVPLDHQALYVQVRDFGADRVGREMPRQLIDQLRQAAAAHPFDTVVLDLRGNPGGIVAGIVNVAALWSTDESAARMLEFAAQGVEDQDHPTTGIALHELEGKRLVLLVDGQTGAGTEWLAETLKRHAGALVLGRKTAGGLKVRRGYFVDDLEGAHFDWPEGEIFARDGMLLSGQGVAPDVVLDDARMVPVPMGRSPTWLSSWLDTDLAAALAQRDRLQRSAPVPWHDAASSAPALCAGLGVLPLPAGPADVRAISGAARVRTATRTMTVESAGPADDFGMQAERKRWADKVRSDEEWMKTFDKKATAHRAEALALERKTLAEDKSSLAGVTSWDAGVAGGQVIRSGGGYWLRWLQDGVPYRLRVEQSQLPAAEADIIAMYTALASGLRLLPGHAAPPAAPGLCVGGAFLALGERIEELRADTVWGIERHGDRPAMSMRLATRYAAGKPSKPSDDEHEAGNADDERVPVIERADDVWLLDREQDCSPQTWPRLQATTLAGLDAVTRRSVAAATRDAPCRVLRALSRLPQAGQPGVILAAGMTMGEGSTAQMDALEHEWRDALQGLGVLPLASR